MSDHWYSLPLGDGMTEGETSDEIRQVFDQVLQAVRTLQNQLDLRDPSHPRLTCPVEDLRPFSEADDVMK